MLSAVLPGDYNGNGMVDAADYVVWRDTHGQSVADGAGADGNGNGLVDDGDYSVWRANFGNSARRRWCFAGRRARTGRGRHVALGRLSGAESGYTEGMDRQELNSLAEQLAAGHAVARRHRPLAGTGSRQGIGRRHRPLAIATVDLERRRRCGFPEVVFGPGKTIEQYCARSSRRCWPRRERAGDADRAEQAAGLLAAFPRARYNEVARTFRVQGSGFSEIRGPEPRTLNPEPSPFVAVISAGTGDLPVAEEARETLDWMGVARDDDPRCGRGRAASAAGAAR